MTFDIDYFVCMKDLTRLKQHLETTTVPQNLINQSLNKAIKIGDIPIIELLIDHYANPLAFPEAALCLAYIFDEKEIIDILLKYQDLGRVIKWVDANGFAYMREDIERRMGRMNKSSDVSRL